MRDTREFIKRAFSKVPRPTADREIAPHECPECERIVKNLKGWEFKDLPGEIIEYHRDSLPLLGPQALQHYLPAWLLYSLDHPESDVMMYTIFHLTPSRKNTSGSEKYFDERFQRFTAEQREAIAAFFEDVRNYRLYDGSGGEHERARELWPVKN